MDPDDKLLADDPWVCPNDRELGLRAKLDSGWSFYTNRQQAGKKFSIKREEIGIIESIIKKAEEVALREEYRIGRLVDRLENIKNNAQGNGITTCLLCNEKFGKISSAPMKCSICGKAACAKCGVDTMSSANIPIFLCKLCNEQREFWKKSGAWFLGELPKHELPPARERNYLATGSFVVSTPEMKGRKGNLLSRTSELYSDSESDASSEDLVDDHTPSRRRPPFYREKLAPDDRMPEIHQPHDEPDDLTPVVGFQDNRRSSALIFDNTSLPRSGSSSPSNYYSSRPSSRNISDDEFESKNGSIHRHSPLLAPRRKRPSSPSIHSRGSDASFSSDPVSKYNIGQGQVSGNEDDQGGSHELDGPRKELKGPLGVIEFTVNFVEFDRRLDIHVHNAKGLRAMDSGGTSDPYVKAHLLPGASKSTKTRTKTLQKTLDPVFNEILTYHGITEADMKNKTLRLQVLDEDRLRRNDFIGETTVPLKTVLLTNNRKLQKVLEPKSETGLDSVTPEDESPGRICISLRYVSKDSKLVVGIIRCSNLLAMDANGYSDPYVKCYLQPDPSKKTKRRTKVKKRDLNPEFNEQFSYKVSHHELADRFLEITVWDHDVGRTNDFIGGVHLGIKSKDSLLKQWFETLKFQNKETKYWHVLSRDIQLNETTN